jgi:hypothetical protein
MYIGNEDCTLQKFEIAAKASFEHHWNNHERTYWFVVSSQILDGRREDSRAIAETQLELQKSVANSLM